MTDKAVLEFKTAPVVDQVQAIAKTLRKMSNQEIVDYINGKVGSNLGPADWSNIVAGKLRGPVSEKAIRAMRELTGV
jgi:hypothetical protein